MNFVTLLQNQAAASVGSFKKPTFHNTFKSRFCDKKKAIV